MTPLVKCPMCSIESEGVDGSDWCPDCVGDELLVQVTTDTHVQMPEVFER